MYSISQNGHALSESKYKIDMVNKTLIIDEDIDLGWGGGIVIDFGYEFGWTFTTGQKCTFKTSNYCTFKTGEDCTFKTGKNCIFKTGWKCNFNTGSNCTFNTKWKCTFNTGWKCTFNTGSNCTFNTKWKCTFNTGSNCTFKTGIGCTFDCGAGCTYLIYDINSQKFNNVDGMSIIFDWKNDKSYILNKELSKLLRIIKG